MQAAPTQDQLFKRMTMISIMIGILFGIVLTLEGLNLSNTIARQVGAPLLAGPLADELGTSPFYFFVFGAFMLLFGKLRALRKQLQPVGQPTNRFQASLEPSYLVFGVYWLIVGGLAMITKVLPLDLPPVAGLIVFPGGLFCSAAVV